MQLNSTTRIDSKPARGAAITNVHFFKNSCNGCYRHSGCLARVLDDNQLRQYDANVQRSRRVGVGTHLFRMSDSFNSIYTILSGCLKVYQLDGAGNEHLVGFRFPGDLVGADAIDAGRYSNSTIALETTYVCEISYVKFKNFAQKHPQLQTELVAQLSRMLREERLHGLHLAGTAAEQRVGSFLIDIATKLCAVQSGSCNIVLSMSRSDIANYLGLAMETVSRTLTQFKDYGLISVRRKNITILDMEALAYYVEDGVYDIQRAVKTNPDQREFVNNRLISQVVNR